MHIDVELCLIIFTSRVILYKGLTLIFFTLSTTQGNPAGVAGVEGFVVGVRRMEILFG